MTWMGRRRWPLLVAALAGVIVGFGLLQNNTAGPRELAGIICYIGGCVAFGAFVESRS